MRNAIISLIVGLGSAGACAQYQGGVGGGGTTNCTAALQILPVELLYFTAAPMGEVITLQWATATEHNNAGFTVERSADGRSFEAITERVGAGNSMQLIDYEAMDRSPLPGINYYRLLQTDLDGTTSYSDVVSVTIVESELFAYPDPADDQVWLHGTVAGEEVTLLDVMGRVLRGFSITDAQVSVDLTALPAGR